MDLTKLSMAIQEIYDAARLAPLTAQKHESLFKAAQVIAEQIKAYEAEKAVTPKAE